MDNINYNMLVNILIEKYKHQRALCKYLDEVYENRMKYYLNLYNHEPLVCNDHVSSKKYYDKYVTPVLNYMISANELLVKFIHQIDIEHHEDYSSYLIDDKK